MGEQGASRPMGPIEIRAAKLETMQERPAQQSAGDSDRRRNNEISGWKGNVQEEGCSVVTSRFSQISISDEHYHFL